MDFCDGGIKSGFKEVFHFGLNVWSDRDKKPQMMVEASSSSSYSSVPVSVSKWHAHSRAVMFQPCIYYKEIL